MAALGELHPNDITQTLAPRLTDETLEQEIERHTLVSERGRAVVLACSLSLLLVVRLVYQGWYGFQGELLPAQSYTLAMLAIWIAVQLGTSAFLRNRIRNGKKHVQSLAYIGAALDVAIPTAALYIMCSDDSPLTVLTSSVNYTYFLGIILSPLRLDVRLCIFNGVCAAISYGLLVLSFQDEIVRQWAGSSEMLILSFFMRCVLLLVGGLAAGYVSLRLRHTIVETLSGVQERAQVLALFGQHVSPSVVNQLLAQPTGQESHVREVCIMVLDIRDFTHFSEARPAEEVVLHLNTLWGFMVRTVNDHHGIVNKFLGDGFLAVFGAPLANGNNSSNAMAAAKRILTELDELAAAGTVAPTEIGIALHSGEAIVGNIGSADRKEYTVIGDVVNVAFRIEALNKEFGSRLLISDVVRRAANVEYGERIPNVYIRGRRDLIELTRVL
jgi:adenylate cyclase